MKQKDRTLRPRKSPYRPSLATLLLSANIQTIVAYCLGLEVHSLPTFHHGLDCVTAYECNEAE